MCHVTSRIDLELVGIEKNYPSSTRCRLLGSYRSRVSCNLTPPAYIRVGKDPPWGNLASAHPSTPKAIQTTQQDIGYYATRCPNLSKPLCCLHHRVLDLGDFPRSFIYLRVSLDRRDGKISTILSPLTWWMQRIRMPGWGLNVDF